MVRIRKVIDLSSTMNKQQLVLAVVDVLDSTKAGAIGVPRPETPSPDALALASKALRSWKLYAHFVGWPNQNGVPELLARCINEGEDALRAMPTGSVAEKG
jgi:hypothetical protein